MISTDSASLRTAPDAAEASRRAVALWLFAIAALVFTMVVLGGVTRLTDSGLSMVEWRPLLGWLPPLTEADWEAVFAKYRQFPEYAEKNFGMTLAEFKGIFWLEYLHRLLGRLIGVAFLLPFLWFLFRGRIDRRLAPRLVAMFVLGGLQGLMGWYMVQSGLVDRPDVSQYRLTAHLGLAVLIYGFVLWTAFSLWSPRPEPGPPPFRRGALGATVLIVLTLLAGGFVAGLDAGLTYNTFPLMDGELLPPGYWSDGPLSPFEDIGTVQFNHRLLAMLTFLAVGFLWIWSSRVPLSSRARGACHLLILSASIQVALGIATLLLVVPIALAAAHQAGALVVLTAALWTQWTLGGNMIRKYGRQTT